MSSRENFVKALHKFVVAGTVPSVSIVGMPQIGKTTCILDARSAWAAEVPRLMCVYLTLASYSTALEFQVGLYNEILKVAKRSDVPIKGDFIQVNDAANINLRIRGVLEDISDIADRRFLVIVDDFDEIRHIEGQRRVTQSLRELIQRNRDIKSQFIISSRRELIEIETEIGGSTLFGICTNQLFLIPEMSGNVGSNVSCGDSLLDPVSYWSGGHPHISNMVLDSGNVDEYKPMVLEIYRKILDAATENMFGENGDFKIVHDGYWLNKWKRLGLIIRGENGNRLFADGLHSYMPLWANYRNIQDVDGFKAIFDFV